MSETDVKTPEVKAAEDAVHDAEAALAEAKRKASHMEFPKWIVPHDSHVDRKEGHVSVSLFPHHHVDREGHVTVLVHDEASEAKALAAREAEKKD